MFVLYILLLCGRSSEGTRAAIMKFLHKSSIHKSYTSFCYYLSSNQVSDLNESLFFNNVYVTIGVLNKLQAIC